MPELTDVVKAALDAATIEPSDTGGDDVADTAGETDSTPESALAGDGVGASDAETPAAEATAETPAETAAPVPEASPADTELAREMEALGLKHVAGKDNRIPYSRVMKIVENARKRASEEHQKALSERQKEYEQAQAEIANFRAVDQLIQQDPERYLQLLSGYVPAYQKFIQPQQTAQVAQPSEQMPQPDVKFPDGSPGYSPEQQQKLFDWIGKNAEERAVKRVQGEYQQRLAPIEQRMKAEQIQAQMQAQAKQQIQELHDAWGKELVDKHEQEIVKYMQEHPKLSFQASAAKVLLPKLQADRTRQREELLKELEARPKAAAPTPATPAKAPAPTGPRKLEDVVREAVAGLPR